MNTKKPLIARVVTVPSEHWKALGEEAKRLGLSTRKGGRCRIVRQLLSKYVRETGALRRLKAQARKRRAAALKGRKTTAKRRAA